VAALDPPDQEPAVLDHDADAATTPAGVLVPSFVGPDIPVCIPESRSFGERLTTDRNVCLYTNPRPSLL
jgi:hypothetical protein